MTTLKRFKIWDLLKFNNVNMDSLTETFYTHFYGEYISRWGNTCATAHNSSGQIEGYILGKIEGKRNPELKEYHGHITAVTVGPPFRRRGLARILMNFLEAGCEKAEAMYVDLFVRSSNNIAVGMYKQLGYVVYRRVLGYYSGITTNEDAFDMRKSTLWDKDKQSMYTKDDVINPDQLEYY